MSHAQDKVTAYPAHWIVGQLLDLKRFSDGTYRATLLGEEWNPERDNAVTFANAQDAQFFVSAWYGTPEMRDVFHVKPVQAPADPEPALAPSPSRKPRGRPRKR